jgi:hypothetical protein
MAKKLTIEELRERAQDVDGYILQTRQILEQYRIEREKIFSPEHRRRLSEAGLREDEDKLRRRTEPLLAARNAKIAEHVRAAVEHRDSWTYENALRTSRFAPEPNPNPGSTEAQARAINLELLETFRRGNSEARAARYGTEDLIAETERAALDSDVATLQVFAQEARNRKLQGVERVNFDVAFRKLRLDEIDQAQAVFSEIEQLAQEADSLFVLWREPSNDTAKVHETLGRFNRRKRAERIVAEAEAEGEKQAEAKADLQQSSAA